MVTMIFIFVAIKCQLYLVTLFSDLPFIMTTIK